MMLLPEGALLAAGGSTAYPGSSETDTRFGAVKEQDGEEEEVPPAIRQLLATAAGAVSPVVLRSQAEMAQHIGRPHKPAPRHSGRMFNLPTDIAVHPTTGDLYITDGYGNSHVHHLT